MDIVKDVGYVVGHYVAAGISKLPWNIGLFYFLGINILLGMWLIPMVPIAIVFWCMLSEDEKLKRSAGGQQNKVRTFSHIYSFCSIPFTPFITTIR